MQPRRLRFPEACRDFRIAFKSFRGPRMGLPGSCFDFPGAGSGSKIPAKSSERSGLEFPPPRKSLGGARMRLRRRCLDFPADVLAPGDARNRSRSSVSNSCAPSYQSASPKWEPDAGNDKPSLGLRFHGARSGSRRRRGRYWALRAGFARPLGRYRVGFPANQAHLKLPGTSADGRSWPR